MSNNLNQGIYSISDISNILKIKKSNVRYWVQKYWDELFSRNALQNSLQNSQLFAEYSSGNGRDKVVNFLMLIELYVFNQLIEKGISRKNILIAHKTLATDLNLQYPFASANLIASEKNVFYYLNEDTISKADKTKQLAIKLILEHFFEKIEFNSQNNYPERYFPIGKEKSVVIDPKHQFGKPTIKGTNILIDTLIPLYKAGESIDNISSMFELEKSEVEDAITYYMERVAA